MAPNKKRRAGKDPITDNAAPERVTWSSDEMTFREEFEQVKVHPTRFTDRCLLRHMGILAGVDNLLDKMGMSCLKNMYYPTFPLETKDFLSTVKLEYRNPRDKKASDGVMTFKIGHLGYKLNIAEICEVYDFKNGEAVNFDSFHGANHFWNHIAHGSYYSNKSKNSSIRNPAIRYVSKLLANTFFARQEAGGVTMKELCLLYQGLKHLILNRQGSVEPYEFGDEINYGCLFASALVKLKNRASSTENPDLFIGAMLTPLLVKAGVDLSKSESLPDFAHINRSYLITSWFLKATPDLNTFHYRLQLRNKERRIFVLPQPAKTNISSFINVRFEIEDAEFLHQEQPQAENSESSGEAQGTRDYLEELNNIELPELELPTKTAREKLLHKAYKAQKKINDIQKKLINKLFRKIKKLQPPDYVSSEENEDVSDSF